ncbi:MAG TPA: PAS domain-containing sensor histidine kinase [Acidimicrobiales bacterium]|nr:PAS domain-containing sensor histidine kinase [Acidimicrobiales bacterium]
MARRPPRALASALHPPLAQRAFWVVQAMVVAIAAAHFLADVDVALEARAFPEGLPVALLVVPVAYAASRFGLAGSAATALWATALWLPDLLLPHDRGHVGSDLVELFLVDFVAFFLGQRIESERLARRISDEATSARLAAEARYRQMFESSRSPLLVLDCEGRVTEANPAAEALLGPDLAGRAVDAVMAPFGLQGQGRRLRLSLPDGRDYRMELVELPAGRDQAAAQLVLEDVTEERGEARRAQWYAGAVVRAEEDERRRLAMELHDEPLQIFLAVARQLDRLGDRPDLPAPLAEGLVEARQHALDAAGSLRRLSRGLRPPTLDQLGLAAALATLVRDLEEGQPGLAVRLGGNVGQVRYAPEVELGVFRIAQEATTNSLRHACASRIVVSLREGADGLVLEVTDDGNGFDVGAEEAQSLQTSHLGLAGMAERARLLGGVIEIKSSPGNGTAVMARVPILGGPGTSPTARAGTAVDTAKSCGLTGSGFAPWVSGMLQGAGELA